MRVSLEVVNLLAASFSGASFNFLNGFQPPILLGGFGDGAKTFGWAIVTTSIANKKGF